MTRLSVVVDRVRAAGHLTKADIGSLVLWKRVSAQTRWAKYLGNTPDSEVRKRPARHSTLPTTSPVPQRRQARTRGGC
jgi:hypothetical protein